MKISTLFNWKFILLLQLTWLPWVLIAPEKEMDMPAEVIEEEDPLIRWKQEDMQERVLEVNEYEEVQDMD